MTDGASEKGKAAVISGGTHWMFCGVLGAVCALVIGIYIRGANSGELELMGGAAHNSYYNLLVQGFQAGQLNLKSQVPPILTQVADPYLPTVIDPIRWSFDGHPLQDTSYYKGKLYLYFGITPALVLFWPYAALTGHYLLHKDAVVIFFVMGFLAGTGLLWSVWRRYFPEVGLWIIVSCVLALGLANFAPGILAIGDVYEVSISCGYAMTMLALLGIWSALHDARRPWLWLIAASLAYGLAVGARPSLLFGAIILLAPVVQAWREKRSAWPLFMAATIPIALIGLGLMYYNVARFDNPLEFGQHYELSSVRRDTVEQFSPRYLWFNFRVGFLALAHWNGHIPFVHDITMPPFPKGAEEASHPFGVLTNIPLVWLALALPLIWRGRSTGTTSSLRWFLVAVAVLFGTCALTICFYHAMCLRYEVEFAYSLVLLAVIGILGAEQVLSGQPVWRWVARCGWGLLLAISLAFNLLECFSMQAEARARLGFALAKDGRMEEAIAQYQKAVEIQPDALWIRDNLALTLSKIGRPGEGIAQFQKSVEIDPHSASARINLANALAQNGQLDEGIVQYQQALEIKPNFADAHYNLAGILLKRGRVDEAIAEYQKTLQIKPGFGEAHYNLGCLLQQKNRMDEAIAEYQKALDINPNSAEAQNNLGNLLRQIGKASEAIVHFQKALQITPSNPTIQNNLAWLLATSEDASVRNGRQAVALARQASELTGGENPVILRTLAAAFAEAGQFSEAVETAQHGLRLAVAQSNTGLAGQLEAQLKLYQAGSPFHGP